VAAAATAAAAAATNEEDERVRDEGLNEPAFVLDKLALRLAVESEDNFECLLLLLFLAEEVEIT